MFRKPDKVFTCPVSTEVLHPTYAGFSKMGYRLNQVSTRSTCAHITGILQNVLILIIDKDNRGHIVMKIIFFKVSLSSSWPLGGRITKKNKTS